MALEAIISQIFRGGAFVEAIDCFPWRRVHTSTPISRLFRCFFPFSSDRLDCYFVRHVRLDSRACTDTPSIVRFYNVMNVKMGFLETSSIYIQRFIIESTCSKSLRISSRLSACWSVCLVLVWSWSGLIWSWSGQFRSGLVWSVRPFVRPSVRPSVRPYVRPSVRPSFRLLNSGLVWSGLVWSGLVWSGLVWSGLVWSGLVWSGLVWSGLVWSGLVGRSVRPSVGPSVRLLYRLQRSNACTHKLRRWIGSAGTLRWTPETLL